MCLLDIKGFGGCFLFFVVFFFFKKKKQIISQDCYVKSVCTYILYSYIHAIISSYSLAIPSVTHQLKGKAPALETNVTVNEAGVTAI